MRCNVRLREEGGAFLATCAEFPECAGRGGTRDEALGRLRQAVIFWLEACPCDQTATPGLEFEVRGE